MKKTQAIQKARHAVGIPYGTTVYGPYRPHQPDGATTSRSYMTYFDAVRGRSYWAAKVALTLMGVDPIDVDFAIEADSWTEKTPRSVEAIVTRCVTNIEKQNSTKWNRAGDYVINSDLSPQLVSNKE